MIASCRDQRDRRGLALRRRAGEVLDPRQPRLQRDARDHRLRRLRVSLHGRRARSRPRITIDDAPHDRGASRATAAIRGRTTRSAAVFARVADRGHRRERGVERRRAAPERAGRRRARRQRRRRHRRRRAAVFRVLQRRLEARHAVRDSGLDRRDDLERDLDRARAARDQPRAVDRVHELDRRDRLRGVADPGRRGGRDPVGRRRRLRHARDDLRLLEDARGRDAVQRRAGRGVAAVRPRARRLRPRRGGLDGRARARGPRAGARRHRSTRRSTATGRPATRITACRWIPTASRSSARCGWRSSDPGAPSKRSATSTITARRPC